LDRTFAKSRRLSGPTLAAGMAIGLGSGASGRFLKVGAVLSFPRRAFPHARQKVANFLPVHARDRLERRDLAGFLP
jgi:hypothetical protein